MTLTTGKVGAEVDQRHVTGLDELQKFLDQLPAKLEANVMRGALRAGMNVVKPVAQANIHSVSGELAKGLTVSTRRRGGTVWAYLKTKGKHGMVGRWLEFGTVAHEIMTRRAKALLFGGIYRKDVHHPGNKPKPFMRPALDSQATAAVVATGNYIKERLASKNGLDTSAVIIKGVDQ